MKDLILAELKTTYGKVGLSEEDLDGIATLLSYSVTSKDGIGKAVKDADVLVKRMQSNADKARRDKSDLEKKLADLKKPHDEADSDNGADDKKKEPKTDDTMPSWAKGMLDTMTTLATEVKTLKGEKLSTERTTEIQSLIKDLPQSVQKTYSRIDVGSYSDEDFAKLKEDVKAEVESITKDFSTKSFSPPYGGNHNHSGGDNKPSEEQTKKIVGMLNL